MKKPCAWMAIGLLGVLAAAGWSQAQAPQPCNGADIAEIQQLYVRPAGSPAASPGRPADQWW